MKRLPKRSEFGLAAHPQGIDFRLFSGELSSPDPSETSVHLTTTFSLALVFGNFSVGGAATHQSP